MGKIKVTPCQVEGKTIEGLFVIEPTVFKDERGYFMETYNQNDFKEAGLDMVFVQVFISRSSSPRASWCARSAAQYSMWRWI